MFVVKVDILSVTWQCTLFEQYAVCVLSNRLLPECMQWSPEVKCGISSAPLTNQYGHCMLVALIHAILKLKLEFELLF